MTKLRFFVIKTVNIHEAKTHLSRLLVDVSEGDEVVIAKNGRPIAKLVSLENRHPRTPGRFLGQIADPDALLAPRSSDEMTLWEFGHKNDPLHKSVSSIARS